MEEKLAGPAVVTAVEPGSAGDDAGVIDGDRIWSVDGEPLRDLIDLQLLLADDVPHLMKIERGSERLEALLDSRGRPLGIEVERQVFGELITCNNECMFCFIDQLPAGLREAMYVKDDDYRLSFLWGNFITLTNLSAGDMERIIGERLSPLYVSLHATEPGLRRRIFGNAKAHLALDAMENLMDAGIEVHLQIVLMRGINDGERLEETLSDIRSRFRSVASIGVVPVGITTTGRKRLPAAMGHDPGSATVVLEQLERWRGQFDRAGPFAADEFFFLAGEQVPPREYYGEYPQLENGIGLARKLIDEFERADSTSWEPVGVVEDTVVVSAPMGLWALAPLGLERYGVETVACPNSFFGETVNVCGLLPGGDVARTLKETRGKGVALLPAVALSDGLFVDGSTPETVSESCGVRILPIEVEGSALMSALTERAGVRS